MHTDLGGQVSYTDVGAARFHVVQWVGLGGASRYWDVYVGERGIS